LRGFHGKGKVLRGRGQAQPFFQRASGVVRSGSEGARLKSKRDGTMIFMSKKLKKPPWGGGKSQISSFSNYNK
jgi:hypothetical protein